MHNRIITYFFAALCCIVSLGFSKENLQQPHLIHTGIKTSTASKVLAAKVYLEPCANKHLDQAYKGFTKEVSKGLGWARKPGKQQFRIFFQDQIASHQEGCIIAMAIIDKASQAFIGCIQARQDTFDKATEEVATLQDSVPWLELICWLHKPYWGKGHYQEALQLMVEYLFTHYPSCDYCMVRIAKDNNRSLGAHIKFGFQPMQAPYKKSGYRWLYYSRPPYVTFGPLPPSIA